MIVNNNIEVQYSFLAVKEIIDRLESLLLIKGITIYARIDQQAEAARTGLELPELEFILFGNQKAGGALISLNPLVALDLPLKVVAWREDIGRTAIAYNTLDFISNRYAFPKEVLGAVDLSGIVKQIL